MNHDTDHLKMDELIALLDRNIGFGRVVGDNELTRLLYYIHQLECQVDNLDKELNER